MLVEIMDYATKLFNNISETMSAATTTTMLPPISTSLNYSSITPIPPTSAKMDTLLNSTVKSFLNNTVIKVVKTNIADYTAQYTLPTGAVPSANAANDYSASSMQSPRQTQSSTFPTLIAGNKNRGPGIIIYPTVSPESIVIPIVSCIFGFPILALIVICCLRRRAKLARERDRRRNYDMQDHAVSLVRFSPIHRLNYRSSRAISLRPERSLSQGFTSLELDTVLEERSDAEQTQTEILNAESPLESTSLKMSFSS